jgi:hypothetical protein
MPRAVKEKIWLVCQPWKLAEDCVVDVRSVAKAKTRKEARAKAADACKMAQEMQCAKSRCPIGEPAGEAVELYSIGCADDPQFRQLAKELK